MNNTMNMNISEYAEKMKEAVISLMTEEQKKSIEVEVTSIAKINDQIMVGLIMREKGSNKAPTFHLNDEYESHYLQGEPLRYQAEAILHQYLDSIANDIAPLDISDTVEFSLDAVRDSLKLRVLETSRNRKFLSDKPSLDVGNGLSVIADICVDPENEGMWSITVNDGILKCMGTNIETLFETALRSAAVLDAPTMNDIAEKMFSPFGASNLLEMAGSIANEDLRSMYVLSTESGLFGASALFYPGVMAKARDILDCNFYVLPSSLHEVLLVPEATIDDPSVLSNMVRDANANVVAPDEILSDHVLYYSKGSGLSTVA